MFYAQRCGQELKSWTWGHFFPIGQSNGLHIKGFEGELSETPISIRKDLVRTTHFS